MRGYYHHPDLKWGATRLIFRRYPNIYTIQLGLSQLPRTWSQPPFLIQMRGIVLYHYSLLFF